MSRRRFFIERFSEGTAVLAGDAAYHLSRVLRAEPGQLYELSDGHEIYLARLERLNRDTANFALLEPIALEPANLQIALLLAVVKFNRFEWALEKATELGAAAIVPLAAERSGKALVAAATKRAARWRKILQESAQQARCLRPPALAEVARPATAFRDTVSPVRIVLSERPGAPPFQDILREAREDAWKAKTPAEGAAVTKITGEMSLSLAVGPEGGWTDAELEAARSAGFCEAALGRNILRTETAVIAALAAAHFYLESLELGSALPSSVSGAARI